MIGAGAVTVALATVAVVGACGGPHTRPPDTDTVAQVAARLAAARAKATSFRAQTVSDYWVGTERFKGDVKLMSEPGAKVRIAALSPAGGSVAVELVCDGTTFVLLDNQKGCVRTGPCDEGSIAQILRVPLAPDDFFHLALGGTPVLEGAGGTVTWDGGRGYVVAALTAPTGAQTIEIDARDGRFDVVTSELRDPAGNLVWRVDNKDFAPAASAGPAAALRVPGTNRFRSAGARSDAIVAYGERDVNVELPAQAFVLPTIAGLPACP